MSSILCMIADTILKFIKKILFFLNSGILKGSAYKLINPYLMKSGILQTLICATH